MKIELFTRVEHCPFCLKAKALLKDRGLSYAEKSAGEGGDWSIDEMREAVMSRFNIDMRTVPGVVIDDKWIGGYTELEVFLSQSSDQDSIDADDLDDLDI